ncbi:MULTISPECIES: PIG-L deacetylase family protein [unclassified Pseudomonas]|jgi:LmbE family N-acetylglucosaminyl deacetylase|uniref:PIG-L deacetylase family protein n=1 Tax=unclassified Pseudomonas TaxID=196821 RepID=UPI00069F9F9F|nr:MULTISPECIES: PIG-L family deacetylase [unclassified Pseudomonas]WPN49944.1 PIG-L family deacetylase [Pseudomonas sp. P8_241]
MIASAPSAQNLIRGPGTTLTEWQACPMLASVPTISHQVLVAQGQRLVIVTPHPDDEVLGCAGLLAGMKGREADVLLVAVTDGEASHEGSRYWTHARLRRQRPLESLDSLARLGLDVGALNWQRLGLPDSAVAGAEDGLVGRLLELVRPGDCVVTTWRQDGHCDHEATGRATADVASQNNASLIEVPVWAWHWARPQDPRIPWIRARKLMLGADVLARKRHAIHAHVSQINADGQSPPVLDRAAIERLLQPFELVFV